MNYTSTLTPYGAGITTLLLVLFSSTLSAQNDPYVPSFANPNNQLIQSLASQVDEEGWIYFKDDANVSPGQILKSNKKALGATDEDSFKPSKKSNKEIEGYEFIRYQQYHNDILVEGAQFTEHILEGKVKIGHGNIVDFRVPSNSFTPLTQKGVVDIAIRAVAADLYYWQSFLLDTSTVVIDELQSREDAVPIVNLVFTPKNRGVKGYQKHYLCWKVTVKTLKPNFDILTVYINAKNGKVEQIQSEMHSNTQDADLDYGYGRRRIDVRTYVPYIGRVYDYLRALDNGRNITTKSWEPGKPFDKMSDERLYFGDNNFIWPRTSGAETTAHWAVTNVYDYFNQVHGQRGWNDNGEHASVMTRVDFAAIGGGISYGGNQLFFGPNRAQYVGDGATIDIAGHEWTHGLMDELNVLDYNRESGALNESFADIFGVLAERFAGLGPFDWQVGEDAFTPIALRDMVNPALGLFPQPSIYLGANWQAITSAAPSPVNDNHGVHINSGVQNRWFSILAAGGNQRGIQVRAVGIDNAARIAFMNMTRFMQPFSNYADAREGSINAARILFGECSFEVEQTTNAWAAVGVGVIFNTTCTVINGPRFMCTDQTQYPLTYKADVPTGTVVTWNVPSTFTTTVSGTGNNTLKVTRIAIPNSQNSSTATITANSSRGGRATITLRLEPCLNQNPNCPPGTFCFTAPTAPDIKQQSLNNRLTELRTDESEVRLLSVYPNPASEFVNVEVADAASSFNIDILDVAGRVVKRITNIGNRERISVSDLTNGVYVVRLTDNDQRQVESLRFIKQ